MGGTDGQGKLVPLVIGQNVRKDLGVRAAARAVVQPDFVPVAAAFEFQVPARGRAQGPGDGAVHGRLPRPRLQKGGGGVLPRPSP